MKAVQDHVAAVVIGSIIMAPILLLTFWVVPVRLDAAPAWLNALALVVTAWCFGWAAHEIAALAA